ncbi:MAG: RNA polymerase sigma factor [Thermomicrobiales bacterium]
MLQAQPMTIDLHRTAEATDRELVERALLDPAAFLDIFERYRDPVHRYCHRRLDSREAAEDATQTIFMRAFASLTSCRDRDGFRSWLFTIAHNVIVDVWRASKPITTLDGAWHIEDSAASPEEQAIARADGLYIASLLGKLPEAQREVVELRLQGFSDKEIARILGKSHNAIRASQHRALVQLRSFMDIDPVKEPRHVEQ